MKWIFVGNLISGERIYWLKNGELAIERDHKYLTAATPAETAEIYDRMSHLSPVKEAES